MTQRPNSPPKPARGSGPVLVYSPDRGVGDLMWHLPTLRAIAATTREGQVALATRPTTRAAVLLRSEPTISSIDYLTYHAGAFKGLREVADFHRLCRRIRPRAVWILEKIDRPALAAALAGVKERRGFGLGHSQERWLTHGPFLPRSLRPAHRIVKLAALEAAHGLHVESREPSLKVDQALSQAVRTSFAVLPRPWIVFGVGASEASKRWPLDRYAALAETLAGATTFWLGGPDEGPAITDASATVSDAGATCVNISDWTLDRAAALMQVADLFVGGDSGPMNVSASVGRPTLALFGATPRLEYSRFITPIGDGISGMGAISVSAVAAEAKALLTPS